MDDIDDGAFPLGAEKMAEETGPLEKLPLHQRPMCIQSIVNVIGSPDVTYTKVQRAIKAGLIKSYTLDNTRRLTRICDVFEAMGIQIKE